MFDTFHDCFPNDESHWVPINLHLLEYFDNNTLNQLFLNEDQSRLLFEFINQHEEQMVEKGDRMALSDEAKIIIRRYLELSNREPIDGLSDRIRDLWLKDQDHYKVQKAKMLEERENISSEIESTLNQVASLKELKDGLTENFRNPQRNKAEKAYSFSSSRALIVIGLGTIGISLFAESVGSYHAACGLALTLFGFFWPIVETKRPALATGGPRSNLAIETQHRSLNHRVGSLSNRIQVMKTNLDTVEKKLSKLGDEPPLPILIKLAHPLNYFAGVTFQRLPHSIPISASLILETLCRCARPNPKFVANKTSQFKGKSLRLFARKFPYILYLHICTW